MIEASAHEARVLQLNVTSHPGLLAVVLGMLSIRFFQGDLLPPGQCTHQQYRFKSKMQEVGAAMKSLQNCVEKPPLSQGEEYINDQIAVLKLPVLVGELFEISGFEPVIKIPVCGDSSFSVMTAKHLYASIALRSGISFKLVQQAEQ